MGHAVNDRHERPPRLSHSRWRRRAGREPMLLSQRRHETSATRTDMSQSRASKGGTMERFTRRLGRRFLLLGGVGVLALAGGIAYASIPDSTGTFHACVLSNQGQVRTIDPSQGDLCKANQAAVSWSQTVPAGPTGATGAQGDRGHGCDRGDRACGSPGATGATGATGCDGSDGCRRRPEPGNQGAGERDGELVRLRHRAGQLPRRNDPDRRRSRNPRSGRRRGGSGPAHPCERAVQPEPVDRECTCAVLVAVQRPKLAVDAVRLRALRAGLATRQGAPGARAAPGAGTGNVTDRSRMSGFLPGVADARVPAPRERVQSRIVRSRSLQTLKLATIALVISCSAWTNFDQSGAGSAEPLADTLLPKASSCLRAVPYRPASTAEVPADDRRCVAVFAGDIPTPAWDAAQVTERSSPAARHAVP